MNGVHDMGGMQHMGPVEHKNEELIFHADWERRVYAMFNALDVEWPVRQQRIELIPSVDYLRLSYYERWLTALEEILVTTDMATRSEILTGIAVGGVTKGHHVLTVPEVTTWIEPDREPPLTATAHFRSGQRVRAKNLNPVGHTRLPRYVRGKIGIVDRDADVELLQDSDYQGAHEKQQHVYTVRFAAKELWGAGANPRDAVYLSLWESYLETA